MEYTLSKIEQETLQWIADEQNDAIRAQYEKQNEAYEAALEQFNETVKVHARDDDFVAPVTPVAPETPEYVTVESLFPALVKNLLDSWTKERSNRRVIVMRERLSNMSLEDQEAALKKMGV